MKRVITALALCAILESAFVIFAVNYPPDTQDREWLFSLMGMSDVEINN